MKELSSDQKEALQRKPVLGFVILLAIISILAIALLSSCASQNGIVKSHKTCKCEKD